MSYSFASLRILLCCSIGINQHLLGSRYAAVSSQIGITQTRAWNFQQGYMAQWLGTSPDSLIIYNDFRESRFVSVILNVHTKKEIKKIHLLNMETEAVLPMGRFAQPEEFTGHWRCDIHCRWSPPTAILLASTPPTQAADRFTPSNLMKSN